MNRMESRRTFIKTSAAGITGIALGSGFNLSSLNLDLKELPIHVFTKCLQFLDFNEMSKVLAARGFDGADLAVRPGGQVLPENVTTDLPKAVKALRKEGIGTDMIVTAINNPDDQFTRPILKTMADQGIKYYRMGYLDYDNKLSVPENLDRHKVTFERLEKVNREYGVHGDYQNHSGGRVGGPVWDLYHLLKDRDPEFIGVQYDIRHATVEGGVSWPVGMKLVSPWIKTTAIKDFIWEKNESGRWIIKNVPLGEGMVNFKTYFELYKSLNLSGPVTIHYEYDLGGAEHGRKETTMAHEEIYRWLLYDITVLKGMFEKYLL